jgi:hypothetical protein
MSSFKRINCEKPRTPPPSRIRKAQWIASAAESDLTERDELEVRPLGHVDRGHGNLGELER